MMPPEVTLRPVLDVVVANVTAPVLPETVMAGGTKVAESGVVVEPVVADVCTMARTPGGVTVNAKVQTPVSPSTSASVPLTG
jgi:hypothetical protein